MENSLIALHLLLGYLSGFALSLFLPWVAGFCETRGVRLKGKAEKDKERRRAGIVAAKKIF